MVQISVYFLFFCLLVNPILIHYGVLPNVAKWIVELIAIAYLPIILIYFAIRKRFYASRAYIVLFLSIFLIVLMGSFYNRSTASALIVGLRHHFKYIPFFLLPLVYGFKEAQIRKIFNFIIFILIVQVPVSFIQRFVLFTDVATGDVVGGTVGQTGVLSLILISAISLTYSLFLSKKIKLRTMIAVSTCLFLPTIINETKITFILLPITLAISTLLFGDKHVVVMVKKGILYAVATVTFTSLFVYSYDLIYGDAHQSFYEYLKKETEGRGYLYYGEEKAKERIEANIQIGRFDSIMLSFENISKDIGTFFFGVGVGNAITSKLGFLETEGAEKQRFFSDMTTVSNLLWELGIIGLLIYVALLILIFWDSLSMLGENTFIGTICLGWCNVVVVMFMALFYQNVFYADATGITFWFISGMVVASSHNYHMEEKIV